MSENRIWKPTELIGHLKLSRSTIYNLIKSGEIKAIRVGRAVLVPTSSIEIFLQRKLQEAGIE